MDARTSETHYDALQVSPDASTDEVRQAYRRLAQQHHPDRSEGDAGGDAMARINQAYEVLSDPHLRTEYDFKLRVAATREARGRLAGTRTLNRVWLMLAAVLTVTAGVLGWVGWRVLTPAKPAGLAPAVAQPSGPPADEPLRLIPAQSIQPWTPPEPRKP